MKKNNVQPKAEAAGGKQQGRRLIRVPTSLTAIDMAIFGVLLALASERTNAAEDAARPQQEDSDAADALLGLSGESAEVLALTAIAGEMFREMERGIGRVRFGAENDLNPQSRSLVDWGADPSTGGWKFSADLPDFSRSMLRENFGVDAAEIEQDPVKKVLDAGSKAGGLNDPGGYIVAATVPELQIGNRTDVAGQGLEQLDASGEKILQAVRELFEAEFADVLARIDPSKLDGTEFAEVEYEEVTVADVDGGMFPLVPLGGGGGGGGGLLASSGGGSSGGSFSGAAIDGYVSGATVFWDVNGNFILDAGEVYTTTDDAGAYTLSGVTAGVGQIVMLDDGIDVNTGGSVGMMATSTTVTDTANAVITPLTLLMSQGMSQAEVATALGITDYGVDLTSYDPVAVLTAAVGGEVAAGTVLLKAQQLFAVINAITGLAGSTTASFASTLDAIEQQGVANFVGETGGDLTAMNAVISSVLPDFDTDVASSAAEAIVGVNAAIGENLSDPTQALSTAARAATLVSQNDLVTQFKSISALSDVSQVKAELVAKLGNYANAELVKANFANDYKTAIAEQDSAGRGIVAGVDELTLTVGELQTVQTSGLLANDRNLGTGTLSIVAVESFDLVWSEAAGVKEIVAGAGDEPDTSFYRLAFNPTDVSAMAAGSHVRVKVDGLRVQVRLEQSDIDSSSAEVTTNNLITKIVAAAVNQSDRLVLTADPDTVGVIEVRRADGAEVSAASFATAAPSAVVDATILADGTMAVNLDDSLAGLRANLRYIVSNGSAQSVGIVIVTGSPAVQSLALKDVALDTVVEQAFNDATGEWEPGSFAISDRVSLTGSLSSGVTQRLVVELTSMTENGLSVVASKANSGFVLSYLDNSGAPQQLELKLGVGEGVVVPTGMTLDQVMQLATIQLPDEFKGDFTFSYRLTQSINKFIQSSRSDSDAMSVLGVAGGDTPTLKYGIGVNGSLVAFGDENIVPLVNDPSTSQVLRLQLADGDLTEERWVEIGNLPTEIEQVWVTFDGAEAADITSQLSLGTLRIDEPSNARGLPFTLKFVASESFVESSYGLLDDAVTFTAVNREVGSTIEATDGAVSLNFDVGGAYGLVVLADADTASYEDVAVSLGQLQVSSLSEGAHIEATITLPDGYTLAYTEPTGKPTLTAKQDVLTNTTTYVLTSNSDQTDVVNGPLYILDGLQITPPENESATGVTASVLIQALDDNDVELSAVSKTLTFSFEGVADGVNYDITNDSARVSDEDYTLSIADLFYEGNNVSLAQAIDSSETLYFVLRGLPTGSRLIDINSEEDIGRISGDDIILTELEALTAGVKLSENESLAASPVSLFAYTQEPGTISVSAYGTDISESYGGDVTIQFDAVADAPFLSLDERVRGLVNVADLSDELAEKTTISIPASAYLQDTDGSESLWFRLTAQTTDGASQDLSEFTLTGVSGGYFDSTHNAYFVSALELSDLLVSRPEGYGAFDGVFTVDAVSIEGLASDATAQDAAAWVYDSSSPSTSWAVSSGQLTVEFLQPAAVPTVTLSEVTYKTLANTSHVLDFTIDVASQAGDLVTILMTGVPANGTVPAKFYRVSGSGEPETIGAPAEVQGVWVFDADSLGVNGDIIRVVLPAGAELSADTPFDVTAFAVDSLGLTNASSPATAVTYENSDGSAFSGAVTVPAEALDPIIIDTTGDGLDLRPGPVSIDLNIDGTLDSVAWVAPGSDDAFLVFADSALDAYLDNGNNDIEINGDYLVTEFLAGDATTDALVDLSSLAGDDAKLTAEELPAGKDARLWFDFDADGKVDQGELKAIDGFELNLSKLSDNAYRDTNTGAIVAGGLPAGAISGTYDDGIGLVDLSGNAVLSDVYLPVTQRSASNESQLSGMSLTGLEDDPDGFDLATTLWGDADWLQEFDSDAQGAIGSGAKVLLTISAAQAGTTFNLSQGARLEGQVTDTWLTLWDPTDNTSLSELRLFTSDNYSGPVDLTFRATVVYSNGTAVNSYTVAREVALDITPVADRPDFTSSNLISRVTVDEQGNATHHDLAAKPRESVSSTIYSLDGVYLSPADPGESVTLTITPPANLPTGARLLFKGEPIALTNGAYVVNDVVDDVDQIWVEVPAYASGTYKFAILASASDNGVALAQDKQVASQFAITVKPVAQAPVVSLELLSTATELTRAIDFKVDAELKDKDGSEEIATITINLQLLDLPQSGILASPPQIQIGSVVYSLEKVAGSLNGYQLVVPKATFDADADGVAYTQTLTATLLTPEYYDGRFTLRATATSVEKSDVTARATSPVTSVSGEVTAVAQDLLAFDVRGLSVNAGQEFKLSSIVSTLSAKDSDETIGLRIEATGLSANSSLKLFKDGQLVSDIAQGGLLLRNVRADLESYTLKTNDSQGDFSLQLTAQTFDAGTRDVATTASSLARTVSVGSKPLLTPTLVDATGGVFVNALTIDEGGAAVASIGVTVGSRLNPTSAEITITPPEGAPLTIQTLVDGLEIEASKGSYVISASQLSKGLLITTTDSNFSGDVALDIDASVIYRVNGSDVVKSSSQTLNVNVLPVTDGVNLIDQAAIEDDGSMWSLSDLVELKDPSETVVSVTLTPNVGLEIKTSGDDSFHAIAENETINGADLETTSIRLVPNANGDLVLGMSVVSRDQTAASKTEALAVTLSVAPVSDEPTTALDEDLLRIFSDDSRTQLLQDAVELTSGASEGPSLHLTIGAFSSADSKEVVSAVLSGDAIVSGTSLYITDLNGVTTAYAARLNTYGQETRYEITVPGNGANFAEVDATLVLPSNVSLVGSRAVQVTARSVDGTAAANEALLDADDITILSTGLPAAPVVGFDSDFELGDIAIRSGSPVPFELALSSLVRGIGLTSDQIIELVVPAGLTFVNVTPEQGVLISSTPALGNIPVYRLTYAELQSARVTIDPSQFTGLQARIGVVDGFVNDNQSDGTRYTYSKFGGISYQFGDDGTSLNDVILIDAETTRLDLGGGDDVAVVSEAGLASTVKVYLGGAGRDALDLSGLNVPGINGEKLIVDLNQEIVVSVNADGTLGGKASIEGFEVVLGTDANDAIVGTGDATDGLVLRGRGGDDYLVGGSQADIIEGGVGSDVLLGSGGGDYFIFNSNSGADLIEDFNSAEDHLIWRGEDFDLTAFSVVLAGDLLSSDLTGIREMAALADPTDWVLRLMGQSDFAVVLANSSQLTQAEILATLRSASDLGINVDVLDPLKDTGALRINAGSLAVPVLEIATAAALGAQAGTSDSQLLNEFFGDHNNFDDIGSALTVIADAKFEQLVALNGEGVEIDGLARPELGAGYRGFSGSSGDDVLVANSKDSVLFGGMSGDDRLIGDRGDDILMATVQSEREQKDIVSMEGGGGADTFAIVNLLNVAPEEITDTLNSIYSVRIEDFNRSEGDRIQLAGFGQANVDDCVTIGDVTQSAEGIYEQVVTVQPTTASAEALTVVFDISFMRQFDSEFQIRHADFDAV